MSTDGSTDWYYTDDHGLFSFGDLPPGRYRLALSKPAYLATEYGAKRPGRPGVSILVREGESVSLTVKLARGAVIAGTVFDEGGVPLPSVWVHVLLIRQQGTETRLVSASGEPPTYAVTDDRGQYRFYGLAPGEYLVGVTAGIRGAGVPGRIVTDEGIRTARQRILTSGSTGLRVSEVLEGLEDHSSAARSLYVPTFLLKSTTLAGASLIALTTAEERTGIDVFMQRGASVELNGRVLMPDGSPAARTTVAIFPAGAYIPVSMSGIGPGGTAGSVGGHATASTTGDGRFTIRALTSGTYSVVARTTTTPTYWARTSLVLGDDDVQDFTVSLQPASNLSGRIALDSDVLAVTPPVVSVGLRPVAAPGAVTVAPVTPDKGGGFTIRGIMPGQYALSVTSSPPGWTPRTATFGGRDILDLVFDLDGGSVTDDITITVTNRTATLAGTFTEAGGRAASDYYVVLFPRDGRYRIAGSPRIRAVRPGTDGRFAFTHLSAGDYLLAAVWDVETDEWHDARFLDSLEGGAISVSLGQGDVRTQDIRISGER